MAIEVVQINESQFQLQKVDTKTGKVSDVEKVDAEKALDQSSIGRLIGTMVRTQGSMRLGWLSFLSEVYKSPRLDGFVGTGDKESGKLSPEFKAAIREAEGETVRQMVESKALSLPADKTKTEEQKIQLFLSSLREDKNYSNAKSHTSRYVAFVGKNIVTEAGYIIPVPVQKAQIDALLNKAAPAKKSVSKLLDAVQEFMDKDTISSDDAMDSLAKAKALVATLQGIVNHYADLATHHASIRSTGLEEKALTVITDAAKQDEEALM